MMALRIALWIAALVGVGSAQAQTTSLSLSSGSAIPGRSVSLNLSLNSGASAPAGLQWSVSFPTSDVASVTAAAGSALSAAGKNLNCNAAAGTITCIAAGMNSAVINSGVVATLAVQLSSTGTGTTLSLAVSKPLGVLPDGTASTVSATGGTVTVSTQPTISSLQCTPTSVATGATSSCTVTLSQPAPSTGAAV